MRRILLVILGFGVVSGFGSAFAHARWRAHHHGGCEGGRWSERWNRSDAVTPPAPVQTVVVPQAAPPPAPIPYAAPAPQVFVITVPTGAAQPTPVVVTPAPAAAPAPSAAQ